MSRLINATQEGERRGLMLQKHNLTRIAPKATLDPAQCVLVASSGEVGASECNVLPIRPQIQRTEPDGSIQVLERCFRIA